MDEKTLPVSSHSKIFEVVYLLLIFSLFLCLGNDRLEFLTFRMILGGVLLAGLFFLARSGGCGSPNKKGGSLALFFFGALIFFQFVRAFLAYYGLVTPNSAFSNNLPPAQFMLFVPVWCFCMGVFCLSFSFLWTKGRASHFLNALVFSAFFLAINFIPTLLVVAKSIRGTHQAGAHIFLQPLYFHPWMERYVLAITGHSNVIGDILAVGFFPALGLLFYFFYLWSDRKKDQMSGGSVSDPDAGKRIFATLLWFLTAGSVIAVDIFLQFSRGTILCFAGVFIIYLLVLLIRFFSVKQLFLTLSVFTVLIGFLVWGGRLNNAVEEVFTVEKEMGVTQPTDVKMATKASRKPKRHREFQRSSDLNREGAMRAVRIYFANPVWGVGSGGYQAVAINYSSDETRKILKSGGLAMKQSMNHYLTILAEQGSIGAFLYFSFLIAWFVELVLGLFKTKSRFKFIAALSLAAPVVMILLHANISFIMERFSIASLVYACMGASLAVLRPDFKHET